jgi:hypothetical protein
MHDETISGDEGSEESERPGEVEPAAPSMPPAGESGNFDDMMEV